MDLNLIMNI